MLEKGAKSLPHFLVFGDSNGTGSIIEPHCPFVVLWFAVYTDFFKKEK